MFRKILTFWAVLCLSSGFAQEAADSLSFHFDEIIVMPDDPVSRWDGSTLVSTIVGTPLARLGNALEVLAQLPMIEVADDGISVKGRGIPEIYIDGRLVHDLTELRTLQSGRIKKIGLQTVPGAQYDAATRSVIEITTRRDFLAGLSLFEETEVKARRKWSISQELILRYFTGNWEFFGEGIGGHSDSRVKGTTVHRFLYDGRPMEIGSSQDRTVPANEAMGRIGFNYGKDGKSFGGYYRADRSRSRLHNAGREWSDDASEVKRVIRLDKTRLDQSAALYYDGSQSEKYHLHFDGAFRRRDAESSSVTTYPGDTFLPEVRSLQDNPFFFGAAKLYADFPAGGGKMTIGTEDSYTRIHLDYRMLNEAVSHYIPSSSLRTCQASWTAFASWQRNFEKIGFRVGARYENIGYSFSDDGAKDTSMHRHDHFLSPDVACNIRLSDVAGLDISYRMSAVRPPYAQLSGGLVYTGLHEIEGGNPALRDEHQHCFLLSGMWRDFMMQVEYLHAVDTYGFVKQLYPASTPQVLMHPVNLDVSSMSAYLIWGKRFRGWMPDVTLGCFSQWLALEGERYDRPVFSYRFHNVFSLPRHWIATATVSGNSAGHVHTQLFEASWFTMDVSAKRSFFNDCFDVRLVAKNIFCTDHNGWRLHSYGIVADKRQSYDSRSVTLSLTYRFQPRKSRYLGGNASETEAKRL